MDKTWGIFPKIQSNYNYGNYESGAVKVGGVPQDAYYAGSLNSSSNVKLDNKHGTANQSTQFFNSRTTTAMGLDLLA